jgi:hypothetical protein
VNPSVTITVTCDNCGRVDVLASDMQLWHPASKPHQASHYSFVCIQCESVVWREIVHPEARRLLFIARVPLSVLPGTEPVGNPITEAEIEDFARRAARIDRLTLRMSTEQEGSRGEPTFDELLRGNP